MKKLILLIPVLFFLIISVVNATEPVDYSTDLDDYYLYNDAEDNDGSTVNKGSVVGTGTPIEEGGWIKEDDSVGDYQYEYNQSTIGVANSGNWTIYSDIDTGRTNATGDYAYYGGRFYVQAGSCVCDLNPDADTIVCYDGGAYQTIVNVPVGYNITTRTTANTDDATKGCYIFLFHRDNMTLIDSGYQAYLHDSGTNKVYFYKTKAGTAVFLDNIMVIEGSERQEAPDATPPVLSNINCTSHVNATGEGDLTEPYNSTGDLTPTFKLDTDENADCDISDSNTTHWTACATTGATSHVCTLPYEYHLTVETDYMYVNCTNEADLSTYDEWEIWTIESEAVGATGDTIEVWQSVEIVNYTNTELVWNRSICAVNFYAVGKSLDIPALAGWTLIDGADPLLITPQSKNCTVYQNLTLRPMYDEIIEIGAVTLGGAYTTEPFNIGNLIDPPHAFIKDGMADCAWNTTIDTEMNISHTLMPFGIGNFILNERLTVDGLYKNDTLCTVYIPDSGNGEIYIKD